MVRLLRTLKPAEARSDTLPRISRAVRSPARGDVTCSTGHGATLLMTARDVLEVVGSESPRQMSFFEPEPPPLPPAPSQPQPRDEVDASRPLPEDNIPF